MSQPTRVLVTGAGGPAGIAVIRRYLRADTVDVFAADLDPFAAALYLVPADRRMLVPAGDADDFVDEVLRRCRADGIEVVVPTVDAELLPLARRRGELLDAGVRVAITGQEALNRTLDKWDLVLACAATGVVPRTELLDRDLDPDSWTYPAIVKPRHGSGSRGIVVVDSADGLDRLVPDDRFIVQEYLPGEEYSLDTFADLDGHVVSVVPRSRLRVDSGVSVAGRTLHDPELDQLARSVFAAVGLTLVANVQCRRDPDGRPRLLEVNPRFPGALPLTIHSGVDMPMLCLDAVLGRPVPASVAHADRVMVRYLDDQFLDPAEVVPARVLVAA